MAKDNNSLTKSVGIKCVGSNLSIQTVLLQPGNTCTDVLKKLNLDAGGFQLSNARDPDRVYRGSDVLYALCEDGDLLYASALVTAGTERQHVEV